MQKQNNNTPTLLFAAGGTGGHLFPAVAVADYLRDNKLAEIIFIGTARMESELVPKLGYDFRQMSLTSPTKKIPQVFTWLSRFTRSFFQARKVIQSEQVQAVICVGAYIGLPPGFAAAISRTPLYLMESNVNLGKANKSLAPYAKRVFTSYQETDKYLPKGAEEKAKLVGNPIRKQMMACTDGRDARADFGLDSDTNTLLVMGGSLGALSINKAIETNLTFLENSKWQVIWQTGKNYSPPEILPSNIVATPFLDNMANAYSASDLVLCRSGATTCSELRMLRKPAILIPLPSAGSGEQDLNARAMEKEGGAIMVSDSNASEKLGSVLNTLFNDDQLLKEMRMKHPQIDRNIAKVIAETVLSDLATKQTDRNKSRGG